VASKTWKNKPASTKHPGQAPMALMLPFGIFQLLANAEELLPHLALQLLPGLPKEKMKRNGF
jgi:hypothetical protein